MTTDTRTQHTPGPWTIMDTVTTGCGGPRIQAKSPDHHFAVADLWGFDDAGEELANARLIAAAPDILAALEECMEFWDDGFPVHPGALLVDEIRALINKAKGQ